jgi:dTDP-4-dehydrorhamnose reductase
MKVLILGIDGMIGHKIAHSLSQDFELFGSSRKNIDIKDLKIPNGKIVYHDFLFHNLEKLLKNIYPDIIINCIGITTRRGVLDSISNTQFLNSELPHLLDNWSKKK